MTQDRLLGLPLDEALAALKAEGIEPTVVVSRAPRRPEEVGALRVVRLSPDRATVTVCAFCADVDRRQA